jgi:hypothetical protein
VLGLAARDHRFDPPLPNEAAVLVVVVAAAGDDAVGAPSGPADAATDGWHAVEQREQLRDVVTVTAAERPASGMPPPSTRRCCLLPRRPRSIGLGPVCEFFFRLHVAGVGDRARPVDLPGRVQPRNQERVQLLPYARSLPLIESTLAGHPRAEA